MPTDFQNTGVADALTDAAFEAALVDTDAPETDVRAADEPASSSESVEHPEAVPEPATEPDTEGVTEPDKAADDPAEEGKEAEPAEDTDAQEAPAEGEDGKLNWDSAPENFRKQYDTVKSELRETLENRLDQKFLTDPDAFLSDLHELSTVQFTRFTQDVVKRGIDQMPEGFAAYMVEAAPEAMVKALADVDPDLIAKHLLGDGVSAAQAKRIIAQVQAQDLTQYLDENDAEGIGDKVATPQKPRDATGKFAKPDDAAVPMTAAEIDARVEARLNEINQPKEVDALETEVYTDVMEPVEALLNEAGLTPSDSDTPQEKQYKEWARKSVVKDVFEFLSTGDNEVKFKTMNDFIQSLDKNAAKNLAKIAKIKAADKAGELIEMVTLKRAEVKTKGTTAPKGDPPKKVPSTGAVPQFGNNGSARPSGAITEFSDDDWERAGLGE